MPKLETKLPLRSWVKPEVNRLLSGGAEFGGDTGIDGSAILS
jgi:hypothetical protein